MADYIKGDHMWYLIILQLANGGNYVGTEMATVFDTKESCFAAKSAVDSDGHDWQVRTYCVKK